MHGHTPYECDQTLETSVQLLLLMSLSVQCDVDQPQGTDSGSDQNNSQNIG